MYKYNQVSYFTRLSAGKYGVYIPVYADNGNVCIGGFLVSDTYEVEEDSRFPEELCADFRVARAMYNGYAYIGRVWEDEKLVSVEGFYTDEDIVDSAELDALSCMADMLSANMPLDAEYIGIKWTV